MSGWSKWGWPRTLHTRWQRWRRVHQPLGEQLERRSAARDGFEADWTQSRARKCTTPFRAQSVARWRLPYPHYRRRARPIRVPSGLPF